MKTIGLLGGTSWPSTIDYYTLLNTLVHNRLGGSHSAKILLKSVDYHDISSNYGKDDAKVAELLREELQGLIALKPDCIVICCNSLHKFYDMIKHTLHTSIPVFHAVELVAEHIKKQNYKKVLLLATKFTMEDGFFAKILQNSDINVIIPNQEQRNEMHRIHLAELYQNIITEKSKLYFENLIKEHRDCDAVVLGCTEYPLLINQNNSVLPIINPVNLQTIRAVDFALE